MARSNGRRLAGKKLLILDGSKKAIEIVEQARALGIETMITDYNSPEISPAKLVADRFFDVSTSDIDAVVDLIRREGIDGVLPGFSDRWLPTYAEICARAGLPAYASAEQLRLFTDKKRYKALLAKHDVPTVRGFSRSDAEAGLIPEDCYPILVKPADGSGSRGISRCNTPQQLRSALQVALEYSWTGEVVIERYLPGEEATAFWVFRDGEYFVTMIANRHMVTIGDGEYRLPIAYTSPSYLVPRYLEHVAPRVRGVLREAGIQNGMMFIQGLVKDGEFFTYDIGYRVTPTQEYRILEELCGINPLKMLIDFAVTGSMGQEDLRDRVHPDFDGYGFNVSTLTGPGEISGFDGLDETAELPGVLAVTTSMSIGDVLPPEALGQLRQVVVRTVGVAPDKVALAGLIDRVVNTVKVYGPGQEGQYLTPEETVPSLDKKLL